MADPITVESITSTVQTAEELTPEQKTFLETNVATLPDDVADRYGIEKPPIIATPPKLPDPVVPKVPEGTDPEDEKKIGAIVDARMAGLTAEQRETAVTVKVDSFLNGEKRVANASIYRDAMIQFAKHPVYQGLSAKELFNIVAGDELMRLGARAERVAAAKARGTQTNSSSGSRQTVSGVKKDWNTASPEEFHAKQAEVLGRQGQ